MLKYNITLLRIESWFYGHQVRSLRTILTDLPGSQDVYIDPTNQNNSINHECSDGLVKVQGAYMDLQYIKV
jgi:hypothetical protein